MYIHIATALIIDVCTFNLQRDMGTGSVRTGPMGGIMISIANVKGGDDEGERNGTFGGEAVAR